MEEAWEAGASPGGRRRAQRRLREAIRRPKDPTSPTTKGAPMSVSQEHR